MKESLWRANDRCAHWNVVSIYAERIEDVGQLADQAIARARAIHIQKRESCAVSRTENQ